MSGEITISAEGQDELAKVVIARCRTAYNRQHTYIQHQGKTVAYLKERADKQYNREYTSEDIAAMSSAFGNVPSRYYGIVQQKVNASFNWKIDLVINNLDSICVCVPTPNPDLDKVTKERIRTELIQKLQERAIQSGIADINLLMREGRFDPRVKSYLQTQALSMKEWEQAKLVSAAKRGATKMQRRMHDILMEGDFRSAYFKMSFDQILHGVGYIRFPNWKVRPMLEHTGKNNVIEKFKRVPMFQHVSIHDFFPIDDGPDLQTNSGNTEIRNITKSELISCALNKDYDSNSIKKILEDYEHKSRDWLWSDTDRNPDDEISYWGLDEPIQILIHEGYFSGKELSEANVTSEIPDTEYVNAKIEVCGERTIRCQVMRAPHNEFRSYFRAPFMETGNNIYDYVGCAAMLYDDEQRVNRLLATFEHNIDWATRPPTMYNPTVFDNPEEAEFIVPGQSYAVEDKMASSGQMPEPIRAMKGVSGQYHLIMTQVSQILRMADESCGIPAFAYGAQDMGRTSLGEYSQRMTNALRTIKGLCISEDINFIEPAFECLFRQLMLDEPELREEQDINLQVRGMTGLLAEDIRQKKHEQILPLLMNPGIMQAMPESATALRYAVRNALEQAGVPVDSLNLTDPVMDNALAVAAGQPMTGVVPNSQQVPQLDGRSNVNPANVAAPNGTTNLMQTGPIQ